MPFLRVTFIDGCKAAAFINGDAHRWNIVRVKREESATYDSATGELRSLRAEITEPVSHCYSSFSLPVILTCCSNVIYEF